MTKRVNIAKIELGDRIKFHAAWAWETKTVWRKVVGFTPEGLPEVRFAGWGNFVVRATEIKAHEPANTEAKERR